MLGKKNPCIKAIHKYKLLVQDKKKTILIQNQSFLGYPWSSVPGIPCLPGIPGLPLLESPGCPFGPLKPLVSSSYRSSSAKNKKLLQKASCKLQSSSLVWGEAGESCSSACRDHADYSHASFKCGLLNAFKHLFALCI